MDMKELNGLLAVQITFELNSDGYLELFLTNYYLIIFI